MKGTPSINTNRINANLPTAGRKANPVEEKKLKKACADFEAILTFQLLKTMRQSVRRDGFLKSSHGQETYEMMMDQKIAEEMAHKGEGLGLQKVLYNEISQHLQKKIKVPEEK